MEPVDKRKFERYKIEMPADIVTKSGRISTVACDISEAGVGFKSPTFIPPGTNVSIRFQGQKESNFIGRVVWGTDISAGGGSRYHIGVEFKAVIFPKDKIMEVPSKDEMVRNVIDEIKKLGGSI